MSKKSKYLLGLSFSGVFFFFLSIYTAPQYELVVRGEVWADSEGSVTVCFGQCFLPDVEKSVGFVFAELMGGPPLLLEVIRIHKDGTWDKISPDDQWMHRFNIVYKKDRKNAVPYLEPTEEYTLPPEPVIPLQKPLDSNTIVV